MRKIVSSLFVLVFCTIFVLPTLQGCNSESKERTDAELSNFLKKQIGPGKDYYVMKRVFGYGEPHPVILVFGYIDDLAVCQGLLKSMKHNPYDFGDPDIQDDMFFCQPAN